MASLAAFGDSTLTVSAKLVGSVLLTVENSMAKNSAPGTLTQSVTLGSLSSMTSAPSGFTVVRGSQQATLSSTSKATVVKANMIDTTYALVAQLQRPLPAGVTWRINGVALSNAATATITTAEFGTVQELSSEIVVDNSASNATLDNAVIFTVVLK